MTSAGPTCDAPRKAAPWRQGSWRSSHGESVYSPHDRRGRDPLLTSQPQSMAAADRACVPRVMPVLPCPPDTAPEYRKDAARCRCIDEGVSERDAESMLSLARINDLRIEQAEAANTLAIGKPT